MQKLGKMIKTASRCGLGQTSPHPLLTTLDNFEDIYKNIVRKDVDYLSQFDLRFAVTDSCSVAQRTPDLGKLEEG